MNKTKLFYYIVNAIAIITPIILLFFPEITSLKGTYIILTFTIILFFIAKYLYSKNNVEKEKKSILLPVLYFCSIVCYGIYVMILTFKS